ncbi:MAG: FAD-binding protein [Paenibacillaceae bacterium]
MSGKVDLTEAKIIISGGRGVKSLTGFKPLEQLAEVLNVAVGASRGACDAGYCNYSMQIEQTGKVITPGNLHYLRNKRRHSHLCNMDLLSKFYLHSLRSHAPN